MRISFQELFHEWVEYKRKFIGAQNIKKSISPSTIRRYERDFDKYIKGTELAAKPISEVSSVYLSEFFLEMIETHQMYESCASNILGYFNQAFDFAEESDYISKSPMRKVQKTLILSKCVPAPVKQDAERVLNSVELRALKKSLAEHEKKNPNYLADLAIELALLTGMRIGELVALKWSCIDDMYIHIHESEHRHDYKDKSCQITIGLTKTRILHYFLFAYLFIFAAYFLAADLGTILQRKLMHFVNPP